MGKRKIVQFIHGFSTGGAENLVKQYCILFNKEKIDLLVVALHNHHSIFDKELSEHKIRVIYIDDIIDDHFRAFPDTVKKGMHRVYRKKLVKRIITDFSPDVLHYHLTLSDYVKYINLGENTKIFLTIHSEPSKLWSSERRRQKDRNATEWLIKNKGMRLIALHEDMRKEVNQMFGVKDTIVIKNGVMVEKFAVSTPKEILKKKLGIKESAIVIGHIGRFTEVKNHRFLLDVFEKFLEIKQNSVLVLIGVGALISTIEKLVNEKGFADKVYFLGARSDIPELLHIMDAFVFPSIYEGLPVTLIEAQAARVPCLVSDNVTKEAKISNFFYYESLSKAAGDWAKTLDQILLSNTEPMVNLKEWDMKNIVEKLEVLYGVS